jgi:hypothetical protein
MEVSGKLHDPAALPPGKETPVPLGLEAAWAPEPVWMQYDKCVCYCIVHEFNLDIKWTLLVHNAQSRLSILL